jgi:hypothetical protein
MTVQQLFISPDHDPIDEEVSVLRRKLGTSNLAHWPTLLQCSYRRHRDLSLFAEIKASAMVIQCASRMLSSRTNTIRFVQDGQDSPLVTLRGKYLCGTPLDVEDQQEIPEENKPDIVPRRAGRKPKVARLIPESQFDKDPMLDSSGLPTAPHQLNRLTLDNTKRNSLYKTIKIRIEQVPIGFPRPGSPERAWSKKPMHKKTELHISEGESEAEDLRLRWNKKLVFLDELKPKEPLDSAEICIPVKPILRRPRTPSIDSLYHLEPSEILVKKIVYADEIVPDYSVEDIMQNCQPTKKGRRKKVHVVPTLNEPQINKGLKSEPKRVPKKPKSNK